MVAFVTVVFLCWLLSWALFARLRGVPMAGNASGEKLPTVSVIVPARNESANLRRLLGSLAQQSLSPFEVIVVDDQSEDDTAAVAESLGARVVRGTELPNGWFGKPWACQQGGKAALGKWLLFVDADTVFEPDGLRRIAALTQMPRRVHSICPYHRIEAPYEERSAFFNVIMALGSGAFTLRGQRARKIGLFGQVLLVAASDYRSVGGHEPVRRVVLENFNLAKFFRAAGLACRCYLGKGTISMRMFPGGPQELIEGWSKGFVSGATHAPRGVLVGTSVWISGMMSASFALLAIPFVATPIAIALIALYLLFALQVLYLFRRTGNFSVFNALFFPVSLSFYHRVFFRALRKGRAGGSFQWKGRHVS